MGLSHPTKVVLSFTDSSTDGATAVSKVFVLPQDTASIAVRAYHGTLSTVTADIYVQTSDDEGATWKDCAHFPQFATTAIAVASAQWTAIPVMGSAAGNRTGVFPSSVAASTLAASRTSALPILGTKNRIFIQYAGGAGTNAGVSVDVYANSLITRV